VSEVSDHEQMVRKHHDQCEENKKKTQFGPWINEPNRLEFKHSGIDCLLIRHTEMLYWCGYAGVPEGHPLFGKGYYEIYNYEREGGIDISVHGGLSFSGKCNGLICHLSDNETWWFGWDTAHFNDLCPILTSDVFDILSSPERRRAVYRDIEYVKEETKSLADQLAAL
jgi:hypothetical protein